MLSLSQYFRCQRQPCRAFTSLAKEELPLLQLSSGKLLVVELRMTKKSICRSQKLTENLFKVFAVFCFKYFVYTTSRTTPHHHHRHHHPHSSTLYILILDVRLSQPHSVFTDLVLFPCTLSFLAIGAQPLLQPDLCAQGWEIQKYWGNPAKRHEWKGVNKQEQHNTSTKKLLGGKCDIESGLHKQRSSQVYWKQTDPEWPKRVPPRCKLTYKMRRVRSSCVGPGCEMSPLYQDFNRALLILRRFCPHLPRRHPTQQQQDAMSHARPRAETMRPEFKTHI